MTRLRAGEYVDLGDVAELPGQRVEAVAADLPQRPAPHGRVLPAVSGRVVGEAGPAVGRGDLADHGRGTLKAARAEHRQVAALGLAQRRQEATPRDVGRAEHPPAQPAPVVHRQGQATAGSASWTNSRNARTSGEASYGASSASS